MAGARLHAHARGDRCGDDLTAKVVGLRAAAREQFLHDVRLHNIDAHARNIGVVLQAAAACEQPCIASPCAHEHHAGLQLAPRKLVQSSAH